MYHKNDKNLEELEEKILLYEEILDKVLEGIYITDTEDKVIWFNKTVELLDGVKKEEAIGKKASAGLAIYGVTSFCNRVHYPYRETIERTINHL